MRSGRIFRPSAGDWLEGRVVPSRAPIAVELLINSSVPLPPQVDRLESVRQAFSEFLQQYTQAYDTVLFAPSPIGTTNPSVNQPAFDTQVQTALNTLDTALTTAVATQPAASQLTSQINSEVLGNGPNSLETLLLGLPSAPSSTTLLVTPVTATPQTESSIVHIATTDLRSITLPQVAQGSSLSSGGDGFDSSPVSTPTVTTPQKVRQAFSTFLNSYYSAVQKVLLAPGADGTVNPAVNRPAFDAQVSEAVKILNGTVNTALGSLPTSSNLIPKAQAVIVGGANSLQAKLSALPTPATGQAAIGGFGESSTQVIGGVLSVLMGDVSDYLRGISTGR